MVNGKSANTRLSSSQTWKDCQIEEHKEKNRIINLMIFNEG